MAYRAPSSRGRASPTTGAPSSRCCCGPPSGSTRRCAGSAGNELVALGLDVLGVVGVGRGRSSFGVGLGRGVFVARLERRALHALRRLRRRLLVRALQVEHILDRTRTPDAIALRVADPLLAQELERLVV